MSSYRALLVVAALAAAACEDAPLDPMARNASLGIGGAGGAGAVFVLSNAAAGNELLVFPRSGGGGLGSPTAYPTGGLGSGGGLGNQGGIVLTRGDRLLYAINAGSDEISGFRLTGGAVILIGTWDSNGDLPISLAVHGDLLYVLHNGGDPNVTGFRIGADGSLTPIAGSTQALAAGPDAAQVGFSPDGSRIVVTEKALNQLETFAVLGDGTLGPATMTPSAGETPFGFAFDPRGTLIVSEAFGGAPDASLLSSYRPAGPGWAAVSPLAATTETAACWVVVTPNGKYVYTTNTGSASVSGYAVGQHGSLTLLDADGVTGTTGAGPLDLDVARNGRFLYTRTGSGSISIFRIGSDGSLTHLGDLGGLPGGANGLVAQ